MGDAAKRATNAKGGRRDWTPVIREVENLLGEFMPEDAKVFRTTRARNRYLASPETDLWTDKDVLYYRVLSDLAIAFEDCQ